MRSGAAQHPFTVLTAVFLLMSSFGLLMVLVGGTHQDPTTFDWYNATWRHRVGLEIETNTDMEHWPIERRLNFTRLLRSQNNTAAFDNNSIRVFKYYNNGTLKAEVPSQFDEGENYNKTNNAVGTLVFQLNESTVAGINQTFFIYFDSEDHGPKQAASYPTKLEHTVAGDAVFANTSKFNFTLDTLRGDNLSGLSRVYDRSFDGAVLEAGTGERPVEYSEFTNGTHRFSFNLSRNASLTSGPIRLTVTQQGYQDVYNMQGEPQRLFVTKRYRFYNFSGTGTAAFVKIEQEIENVDAAEVTFRSTQAGATAVDANRTLQTSNPLVQQLVNETDPFSTAGVRDNPTNFFTGVINVNESIPNFLANYHDFADDRLRIGSNMTQTTIQPGDTVSHTTFFTAGAQFTGNGRSEFNNMNTMFRNQPSIALYDAESFTGTVNASSNATVYNRNETVELTANVTSDPFNLTDNVTVTVNKNTSATGDDTTIIMTEQNGIWTGVYRLDNESNTGQWDADVTVYTAEDSVVATDTHQFTVTDQYVANITFKNAVEVVGNPIYANLTVESFRRDRGITGANVSCRYDGADVHPDNITAFDPAVFPGVYSLNFTAPGPADTYTLSCNATKLGNLGNDSDQFRTEVNSIVPNTTLVPGSIFADAVTLADGYNFTFVANVSNNESGTASATNVSIELPSNWFANSTFEQCGDIIPGGFCSRNISVAVPNGTAPGNFSVNVTTEWVNPIGSVNATNESLPVEVAENPVLNVTENAVNGSIGGGHNETVSSFTVESAGNFNLSNVTFACESGAVCSNFSTVFTPANISDLGVGVNTSVNVTVAVPKGFSPGLYNGTINASSDRRYDAFAINVTVIPTTVVDTDTVPSVQIVADNVTLKSNQTLGFDVNATNIGEAFANHTNVSITPPTGWATNTSQQACGELDSNEHCLRDFFVTVPNATAPGNYVVTAETAWANPDGSTNTSTHDLTVDVEENPVQEVSPAVINGTVPVGDNRRIGNFTIESTGNFNVSNATFTCESGSVCSNMSVAFTPPNISTIDEGDNRSVDVNITVPSRFPAGNYSGVLNVSSTGGQDNISVNVQVPVTRTWEISELKCETSSDPSTGTMCRPIINNTGNVRVNVSFSPAAVNNTRPEPQNVSLGFGEFAQINVTYNVTANPDVLHNATYNVSAVQDAAPQWQRFIATVFPAIKPRITVNVTPQSFEQNGTAVMLANVSSLSGFPIDTVEATITPPENTTHRSAPAVVKTFPNTTTYRLDYPVDLNTSVANTTTRGDYVINISGNDTIGNEAFNASTFTVTAKLFHTLKTLKTTYERGDDGSITFNVSNFFREGIAGVSVNLSLRDPDGFTIPLNQDNPFTTSSGPKKGYIDPRPTFSLTDDAPTGLYDLTANASWFDAVNNRTEQIDKLTTFAVEQQGDFQVDWDAGSVWFPGSNFTARMVVSENSRLENADTINVTVLDPDENVFMQFSQSEIEQETTGVYKAEDTIPDSAELGIYWVKLVVEKEGSKAVRYQSFRLAIEEVATGPFDIRAQLLQQEVEQNAFLHFNLTVINQGGESGDSKISYWVSSENGTRYKFVSETVFTPAGQELTLPRDIFIFSNQPTGTYFLQAKVEPLTSTLQVATTNVSFQVTPENVTTFEQNVTVEEETETQVVQPEAPPADQPEPITNISIIDAPRTVNLVRGRSSIKSVIVANSGDIPLNNVSLSVVGVPPEWVTVTPSSVNRIGTENTVTFSVAIDVPDDSPEQVYEGTFLATSDQATTRRPVTVQVFLSLEEKLAADITRLENRLSEVREEMQRLEADGADVSDIAALVTEIETEIGNARSNLEAGELNAALQDVSDADSLLTEARGIIRKLKAPERRAFFDLLPIVAAVILLLAAVLVAVYLVRVRSVEPFGATRERIHGVVREMKKRRQAEQQQLQERKQKTQRLIKLIEAQHEEGIMGDESYEEMRTSAEEKLRKINKQLEEQ